MQKPMAPAQLLELAPIVSLVAIMMMVVAGGVVVVVQPPSQTDSLVVSGVWSSIADYSCVLFQCEFVFR